MRAIHSLEDLFEAFGGPAELGRVIGKTTEHASSMKRRGSVPIEYWPKLLDEASRRRLRLNHKILVDIHTENAA